MTEQPSSDGVAVIEFSYPDSIKNPLVAAAASRLAGGDVRANLVGPADAASSVAAAVPLYTVASVPFSPDVAPSVNVPKICDDCVITGVPLGFTFAFYGQSYDKLTIGTNGIVGFGALDANGNPTNMTDGCCWSRFINLKDVNNNIIALGWADWVPVTVKQIRYETRGSAPNRRFVLQFTNIGENGGNGHITVQLVLYESSNEIALYTTELSTTLTKRTFTQGIENLAATEAEYIAGRDSAKFSLSNDGVKFTPVSPNKPPFITAPANISVNTDPSACVANLVPAAPTLVDDAPGATYVSARSDNAPLNSPFPKGVTTITYTATDVEGLKSSASQTVTVSDKEKPSIAAPANISTRVNRGVSFASVTVVAPSGSDNCTDVPVKVSGSRSDNAPVSAGYPIGATTITWTATDGSGNTSSVNQTVTVIGNAPPVITAPANLSVNTDARACYATVDPGTATATDDTDGTTIVGQRTDGIDLHAPYPKGVTTIKWTATDADGLTAQASQTVTVSDKEKPVLTLPANILAYNDPHKASATVSVVNATAEDNCKQVVVSGARNDGAALSAAYPVGVTTITWTASDPSNNSASAQQTVEVRDNEAPSLFLPPDVEVNATMPSGAVYRFTVTASDNVGVTSVVCSPASGSVFPVGYTTITCTARDAAGNSTSKEFGIDVIGAEEQMGNLIVYIQSRSFSNGIENPLVNQVRAAMRDNSADQSCTKMDDFVHLVQVKSSAILPAYAAYMIGEAKRIQSVMGCAGALVPAASSVRSLPPSSRTVFDRAVNR